MHLHCLLNLTTKILAFDGLGFSPLTKSVNSMDFSAKMRWTETIKHPGHTAYKENTVHKNSFVGYKRVDSLYSLYWIGCSYRARNSYFEVGHLHVNEWNIFITCQFVLLHSIIPPFSAATQHVYMLLTFDCTGPARLKMFPIVLFDASSMAEVT
jgi:hypothetical protein